jgi:hypothetical protein
MPIRPANGNPAKIWHELGSAGFEKWLEPELNSGKSLIFWFCHYSYLIFDESVQFIICGGFRFSYTCK